MATTTGEPGLVRILYLLTDPRSTRFLRGQLAYLYQAGFDVELASAPGAELRAFGESEGVVVHEVPFVREPHLMSDLRALAATVRLIRGRRPHVVNASTPKAGLLGMLAAFVCRVPVRVYEVRGFRFETLTGPRRSLLKLLERVAVRCSNHTVFNSPSLRALAQREGVIPAGSGLVLGPGSGNGVDIERFADLPDPASIRTELGLPGDAFVIGFVGRLVRDKGFVDLLEAFDVLARERGDVWLLVVGEYEAGDPIDEASRAQAASDERIVLTGWVSDPPRLYAAMDVLAFPSYREGFGNAPLEANAAGVPVVGYAATGTLDAVLHRRTGILVPVGDVKAFSKALAQLLDDPEMAAELGECGRVRVRDEFSPQRFWSLIEEELHDWLVA